VRHPHDLEQAGRGDGHPQGHGEARRARAGARHEHMHLLAPLACLLAPLPTSALAARRAPALPPPGRGPELRRRCLRRDARPPLPGAHGAPLGRLPGRRRLAVVRLDGRPRQLFRRAPAGRAAVQGQLQAAVHRGDAASASAGDPQGTPPQQHVGRRDRARHRGAPRARRLRPRVPRNLAHRAGSDQGGPQRWAAGGASQQPALRRSASHPGCLGLGRPAHWPRTWGGPNPPAPAHPCSLPPLQVLNARSSDGEAMSDAMEMAVLSSITHPNVVQVFACLTDMVPTSSGPGESGAHTLGHRPLSPAAARFLASWRHRPAAARATHGRRPPIPLRRRRRRRRRRPERQLQPPQRARWRRHAAAAAPGLPPRAARGGAGGADLQRHRHGVLRQVGVDLNRGWGFMGGCGVRWQGGRGHRAAQIAGRSRVRAKRVGASEADTPRATNPRLPAPGARSRRRCGAACSTAPLRTARSASTLWPSST
jgi:hypothetical protein